MTAPASFSWEHTKNDKTKHKEPEPQHGLTEQNCPTSPNSTPQMMMGKISFYFIQVEFFLPLYYNSLTYTLINIEIVKFR